MNPSFQPVNLIEVIGALEFEALVRCSGDESLFPTCESHWGDWRTWFWTLV